MRSQRRPKTSTGVSRNRRKKKRTKGNRPADAYGRKASTVSVVKAQTQRKQKQPVPRRRRKRPFSAKNGLRDIYDNVKNNDIEKNVSFLENLDTYNINKNIYDENTKHTTRNNIDVEENTRGGEHEDFSDLSYFVTTRRSKPYICDVCQAGFDSKYSMVCHRQNVHERAYEPLSPESPENFAGRRNVAFNNMSAFVYSTRGTRQLLQRNKSAPRVFNSEWYAKKNKKLKHHF